MLSIPATIAAAAERWPPPVSEEMIRIFGLLSDIEPRVRLYEYSRTFPQLDPNPDAVRSWLSAIKLLARLLHFAFELLDLNQMLRVERQRWVITIRFVGA